MVMVERSAARAGGPKPARAALLGAIDERLRELLTDVLIDMGLSLMRDATSAAGSPDVVVVVVGRDDAGRALREARALAGRAPVLAILPFGDELQVRRVTNAGADAIFELDAPLSHLRIKLVRLLEDRATMLGSAGERPKGPFQLGPRAKAAVSAIRKNRGSSAAGSAALVDDVGRRLEQAIDIDLHVESIQPEPGTRARFSFGSHAMLELMLLSLSSFEISLLEHAIGSDLSRHR